MSSTLQKQCSKFLQLKKKIAILPNYPIEVNKQMEECRMELKAQAIQLCKMLSKPDSQRMPFEGVEIAKSLQRIPFFCKFFDMKSQPFINMCITSSIIEFEPYSDVYDKEEKRHIYIILEGRVKVVMKSDESHFHEESQHYLSQFGIFGETEVLFGLEHRNQIITAEGQVVKCMVVEERIVKKIIIPAMQKFIEKTTNFLDANQYFEELTPFEKKQLVIHLSLENFIKGETIIETDTDINQIFFFVYGRVLIVKNLHIKGSNKSQKFKIDQLSEMDSFGEYQAFHRKKSQFCLIAETTGAYYSLDYEVFKESNHRILEMIKQRAIPYPDQQQIQFLHEIKNTLKKSEQKIVKKNKLFS